MFLTGYVNRIHTPVARSGPADGQRGQQESLEPPAMRPSQLGRAAQLCGRPRPAVTGARSGALEIVLPQFGVDHVSRIGRFAPQLAGSESDRVHMLGPIGQRVSLGVSILEIEHG